MHDRSFDGSTVEEKDDSTSSNSTLIDRHGEAMKQDTSMIFDLYTLSTSRNVATVLDEV